MLPEVETQECGRPDRKYIYLSSNTRQKHHSKSKTYVFDHGLFHGDTLNPVPCYQKSDISAAHGAV